MLPAGTRGGGRRLPAAPPLRPAQWWASGRGSSECRPPGMLFRYGFCCVVRSVVFKPMANRATVRAPPRVRLRCTGVVGSQVVSRRLANQSQNGGRSEVWLPAAYGEQARSACRMWRLACGMSSCRNIHAFEYRRRESCRRRYDTAAATNARRSLQYAAAQYAAAQGHYIGWQNFFMLVEVREARLNVSTAPDMVLHRR